MACGYSMNPADYEAWYATSRGHWVGETEYALAARHLKTQLGDSLLDVGCGTGWFTRRAAADNLHVTGLDPNSAWLDYARAHSKPELNWMAGDARELPFADASFDHVLSIAALCFVDDARPAVAECVRVARRRFAIGWLNRDSLLYRKKGRDGGSGAYRGARWHGAVEVRDLFAGLPVRKLRLRSASCRPQMAGRVGWKPWCPVRCRGAACCWLHAKKPDIFPRSARCECAGARVMLPLTASVRPLFLKRESSSCSVQGLLQ